MCLVYTKAKPRAYDLKINVSEYILCTSCINLKEDEVIRWIIQYASDGNGRRKLFSPFDIERN